MARDNSVIGLLGDFIRRHPKTSATIAFNLGIYAALMTKRELTKRHIKIVPDRLADLMPSLPDLSSYLPDMVAAAPKPRKAPRKARKSAMPKPPVRKAAAKRKAA